MNQELYDRVWNLDVPTLCRWLLVAFGHSDQYYWTNVIGVNRNMDNTECILQGELIEFNRAETLYGLEIYDEEGRFVFRGNFDYPRHSISGDALNLSHLFMRTL